VMEPRTVANLVLAVRRFNHLARSHLLYVLPFCLFIILAFSPFFVDQNLWVILVPQFSVKRLCFISSDLNSDSASPINFLLIPLSTVTE
jgi:hypothetical protein